MTTAISTTIEALKASTTFTVAINGKTECDVCGEMQSHAQSVIEHLEDNAMLTGEPIGEIDFEMLESAIEFIISQHLATYKVGEKFETRITL